MESYVILILVLILSTSTSIKDIALLADLNIVDTSNKYYSCLVDVSSIQKLKDDQVEIEGSHDKTYYCKLKAIIPIELRQKDFDIYNTALNVALSQKFNVTCFCLCSCQV